MEAEFLFFLSIFFLSFSHKAKIRTAPAREKKSKKQNQNRARPISSLCFDAPGRSD